MLKHTTLLDHLLVLEGTRVGVNDNRAFTESPEAWFPCGSAIMALDEDGRDVFINHPLDSMNIKHVRKGKMLVMTGGVHHGGMTYTPSDLPHQRKWRPSLHIHLDSTKHTCDPDNLDYVHGDGVCSPPEHAKHATPEDCERVFKSNWARVVQLNKKTNKDCSAKKQDGVDRNSGCVAQLGEGKAQSQEGN